MNLPEIQNSIISRLKNAKSLRYSRLKPEGTANDLFNYHLRALIGKGLIDKVPDGYSLSGQGRAYVADIHHTSDPQLNRLFKVNVITIVSRIQDGKLEILSQRRNSQPSYGLVDVMGGTILKGEDILEGAKRKLKDETGVTAEFKLLGIERRRMYRDDELFSDVFFPICYANNHHGEPITTEYGENFWVNIEQAIKNTDRPFDNIPSILTCLQAIRDDAVAALPFFYNETKQQDNTI
ncbi:NUDIX hydrolase [Candidatus Saccharibacteria bacterium]|nr:NUDIX hydrolase [Candidatus Saccharibacteria bacterium]